MNLLSVAAAYGVVAYFLEGGWAGKLIGIDTATPLAAFVPVIMFALLFGLSMDYEVFLISRMREAWVRTRDNSQAITTGLASTGRVITAAAAIMVAIFAALVPSDQVCSRSSESAWPRPSSSTRPSSGCCSCRRSCTCSAAPTGGCPRLDRRLPQLYIEGRPELHLPAKTSEREADLLTSGAAG